MIQCDSLARLILSSSYIATAYFRAQTKWPPKKMLPVVKFRSQSSFDVAAVFSQIVDDEGWEACGQGVVVTDSQVTLPQYRRL